MNLVKEIMQEITNYTKFLIEAHPSTTNTSSNYYSSFYLSLAILTTTGWNKRHFNHKLLLLFSFWFMLDLIHYFMKSKGYLGWRQTPYNRYIGSVSSSIVQQNKTKHFLLLPQSPQRFSDKKFYQKILSKPNQKWYRIKFN